MLALVRLHDGNSHQTWVTGRWTLAAYVDGDIRDPGQRIFSAQELGQRLRRDPSMVSRLTATYAAQRDPKAETQLLQTLSHT